MIAAVNERAIHAKVISLGELDAAMGAREALHVVHELSRPHHQLGATDDLRTSRTPSHAEQSAGEKETLLLRWLIMYSLIVTVSLRGICIFGEK